VTLDDEGGRLGLRPEALLRLPASGRSLVSIQSMNRKDATPCALVRYTAESRISACCASGGRNRTPAYGFEVRPNELKPAAYDRKMLQTSHFVVEAN
jgi:hypothetical protein